VFAGTLAVPSPECQQSQVQATVRGGSQSVVRRRTQGRRSAASREQLFLLSYADVQLLKRSVESGRRISPSVDLQLFADSNDFVQVIRTPGLSALNCIEVNGS
jgi:ribosomal protein S18